MSMMRAFDANATRSVRRATIVYSVDDIRRNITLRLKDGLPCVLELGGDIPVTAGFTLPGGLTSFSLDGAQRFKFIVSGSLSYLFRINGAEQSNGFPALFSNLSVLLTAGSTLAAVFLVNQIPLASITEKNTSTTVRNVLVDGLQGGLCKVGALFALPPVTALFQYGIVIADTLLLTGVSTLMLCADSSSRWINSSVSNAMLGTAFQSVTSTIASSPGAFINCRFDNFNGKFSVNTTGSLSNTWVNISSFASPATFVTDGGAPQTLMRLSGLTKTLFPNDVDLDNISGGGGGGAAPTAATITVPFELQEQTVSVVDALATVSSKVMVVWGNTVNTDENQPSSSNVTFSAVAASGSISVTVSDNGAERVGGVYKILYILG
jgi:hypothetical protein